MNSNSYSITSSPCGFRTDVKSRPMQRLLMLSALAVVLPLSVGNVHAAEAAPLLPSAPVAASAPAGGASSPQPAKKTELNSDGSTLTPPDTLLYDGQLVQMQKLQRDNLQLKLELQQAQLKGQLHDAESKYNKDKQPAVFLSPPQPVRATTPAAPAAPEFVPVYVAPPMASPSIISMTGVGNVRQALLDIPDFGQLMVRAGDLLPNNWKVAAIDDGGVVVTQQATGNQLPQRMRLPFYVQSVDVAPTQNGGQFAQSR